MKQFTEAELQDTLDAEFKAGYAVGFHDAQYQHRKKLANQRRELRRLNRRLEAMQKGAHMLVYAERYKINCQLSQACKEAA